MVAASGVLSQVRRKLMRNGILPAALRALVAHGADAALAQQVGGLLSRIVDDGVARAQVIEFAGDNAQTYCARVQFHWHRLICHVILLTPLAVP
eukprot:SAG31_NODE_2287_length_6004_cov_2.142954_3_plen_94_part_00